MIKEIDELIAAGKHAEAAQAALAAGEPARAADLYEKIWQFGPAAHAARSSGDPARALRLALEARDQPLVDELYAELTATDDGARLAVELYARARRHSEAAELAERLGELDRAIDYYQRSHRDIDAARLLEAAGRDREAGRLLEKLVDLSTGDERLDARLRLGRILARRAAYPDAARHLQEVRNQGGVPAKQEALRHLVAVLAAMGLRDGARDVLLELRRLDPEIAVDLDVYLRTWRDAAPKTDRSRDLVAGRYRLEKLLGAGGAGRVFLAIDEVSGRTVAVKVMHAADSRGSAAYERFLREARVALALRHPSLVEVYEVSVEHGLLVMEYMPGGSLAQRLADETRAPMTGALIKRMALELIGGLEMAHHRGVVHRDIKPANVFFDARGTAKLGDFGVAHLLDLGQTQTGGLIGTLAYMSPEQITGAPLTITADLYSLGITLFEALTGRLPFLGPDFVAQHLGEDPPAPTTARDGVAPGWDPILLALLKKSPDDRTASITLLRTQLDALDLGGRPLVLPIRDRPSQAHSIAEVAADDPATTARARYQFETPLGKTPISSLLRALDTNLDRTVVLERFDEGDVADAALARVKRLGSVSSPYLQRALSLDRPTRTAVFEAPAGAPLGELRGGELDPLALLRMLKRLARAIASLHELDVAHGSIGPTTVVVDDAAVPTVMAAGLGPPPEVATPAFDVAAVIALAARMFECAPSLTALAAAIMPAGAPAPLLTDPADGEALYGAVDALEIALVRSQAV